ncbi:MAG: response regulator [Desulfobacteraceae bacterium]|nr:response regulator [Desulfobacteraceae bacterium]
MLINYWRLSGYLDSSRFDAHRRKWNIAQRSSPSGLWLAGRMAHGSRMLESNLQGPGKEIEMACILVIDDERNIASLIQEALEMFGHRVQVALNGREGIDKFDRAPFDLVITDILMPEIDGNRVLEHVRQTAGPVPVIGMSGTPWLLEHRDFDFVITKPFPLQRLVQTVESLSKSAFVHTDPARTHCA